MQYTGTFSNLFLLSVAVQDFLFFVASRLTVKLSILLGLYRFRHVMVAIVHKSYAKPTKPTTLPPNTTIYLKSGNQHICTKYRLMIKLSSDCMYELQVKISNLITDYSFKILVFEN
jgi:hypothetical protein